MMLHRSQTGDSPVLEGRKKDPFLPPLDPHQRCTVVGSAPGNDSNDETVDSRPAGANSRSKAPNCRKTSNKSSMSDSFVLPRITNGPSEPSGSTDCHRQRRATQASLNLPVRTPRKSGLPSSKSCPALVSNYPERNSGMGSPDSENDEYDEKCNDVNIKSPAQNADNNFKMDALGETSNTTKRLGCSQNKNTPRYGFHREGPGNCLAGAGIRLSATGPTTRDSVIILPDIFVPNATALKIAGPDPNSVQRDRQPRGKTHNSTNSISELKSHRNNKVTSKIDHRFLPPETATAGDMNTLENTHKSRGTGVDHQTPSADRTITQAQPSHQKANKKKRKQKKLQLVEPERSRVLRDTSRADIKCMHWLADGHREKHSVSPEYKDATNLT